MRCRSRNTRRALLCIVPLMVAWTPANPVLTLAPQSRLWVDGTSTMRSFQCKAATLDARIETAGPGAVTRVLAGEKSVSAVELVVPAEALDCSNSTMNKHMLKALKAEEHRAIVFRLSGYETTKTADGVQGEVTGDLTLGGVRKAITMKGSATNGGDGMLRVVGTHEIRMSDYGLKAPTLMLGTMKVGDVVKVSFDLALKE